MARRYRFNRPEPPLIIRHIQGTYIIGKQTRNLQMGDRVLISRDGMESIGVIERHQGDLIYLISQSTASEPVWLHAKYIIAKIIWPELEP